MYPYIIVIELYFLIIDLFQQEQADHLHFLDSNAIIQMYL